jgi:hypothetical protein
VETKQGTKNAARKLRFLVLTLPLDFTQPIALPERYPWAIHRSEDYPNQ